MDDLIDAQRIMKFCVFFLLQDLLNKFSELVLSCRVGLIHFIRAIKSAQLIKICSGKVRNVSWWLRKPGDVVVNAHRTYEC
jgi:hypothetical protein